MFFEMLLLTATIVGSLFVAWALQMSLLRIVFRLLFRQTL
jgi:hypothetical protein